MRSAVVTVLLLIVSVSIAADAQDAAKGPKSPAAVQAVKRAESAIQKAEDTFRQAKVAALKQLVTDLKAAMGAATRISNLDEANAIAAEVEKAEVKLAALSATIPSDAIEFEGRYFKVVRKPATWAVAREKCEAAGGRLAVVSDEECNRVLREALGETQPAWIGLRRGGDSWVWVDGAELSYSQWMKGEPNDARGVEDFVSISNAGWNDEGERALPFICEWDRN